MKKLLYILYFSLFTLLVAPLEVSSQAYNNRIEGQVYAPNRSPVENAYVELLNDVESVIARTRTTPSGRFSFGGIPPGRFIVKVLPIGGNFLVQTQEVQLTTVSRNGGDTAYIDVYLRIDKRGGDNAAPMTREVLFVQEVPSEAKKLYDEGVAILGKTQEKGEAKLEEAIKLFPTYFDALSLLGRDYIGRKEYEKGYPYLLRAIDINARSYASYYSLGFAFYNLKQYPAALEAAKAAIVLMPESSDGQLLYGTVLRITGDFTDAEKALVKANTLTKKMNSDVHWQLALLYNKLNRNQETINELETFLKLVPGSPDKNKIQEMIVKLKASATNRK